MNNFKDMFGKEFIKKVFFSELICPPVAEGISVQVGKQ
jgi:hypothetical protein